MKKILFFVLCFPAIASADWVVETCNGQWKSSQTYFNDSQLVNDANCTRERKTNAEWQTISDNTYAPDVASALTKKRAEIQQQAMSLYNQYALYSDIQSVIDYKAALRAVPTTAQAEMAGLPDVANVKNYQPTWPAKPKL